mmetsp:Transcript_54511/g.167854  ORF Transcript_54511/g.167854 Transcript_54511/m.167854 type:complete len:240 (-) Transcript_54511:46-765(-)
MRPCKVRAKSSGRKSSQRCPTTSKSWMSTAGRMPRMTQRLWTMAARSSVDTSSCTSRKRFPRADIVAVSLHCSIDKARTAATSCGGAKSSSISPLIMRAILVILRSSRVFVAIIPWSALMSDSGLACSSSGTTMSLGITRSPARVNVSFTMFTWNGDSTDWSLRSKAPLRPRTKSGSWLSLSASLLFMVLHNVKTSCALRYTFCSRTVSSTAGSRRNTPPGPARAPPPGRTTCCSISLR